jgi:carboxyl-terminal processing protease
MTRFAARAAALLALVVAWGFAAGDRLSVPLFSEARAGDSSFFGSGGESHDLASLKIFNRVVLLVKENYFDPKRIDPRQMLVDSLDYVEKSVPEVMVDGDVAAGKVKVTVGGHSQDYPLTDIDSIFKMSLRLGQVMGFVQKNLEPGKTPDQLAEIEYALVNGMLSSLDPHSTLLKPEYFKEMKLSTKGEFGGLGFVISMKEGQLTVVKVLKGTKENPTPAARAGIKPKDRILRIADESTVNMDLNDAVDRLRGKPGSKVSITMDRKGWDKPREMSIARAQIDIESVEHKLLASKVGYVRIKNFQGNTSRDLQNAIRDLKGQAGGKLAGLVLDLRGNPGGLLEQAIQVSDVFVDSGTIVTTVGMNDRLREVKRAHSEDTERDLPLAVLVNNGSASASEIVSGALKNLDRAVIVGRQTFGKGSVQVLYDFPDQSALKLTIAQYLTPGDVSIQETGITPDIELIPAKVTKDEVSAFAPAHTYREMDLERHLSNPGDLFATDGDDTAEAKAEKKRVQEAAYSLRYLREDTKDENDPEAEEELPDEIVEDFQIDFARDLLLAAPATDRSTLLKQAKTFLEERSTTEDRRIADAIKGLGVDWAGTGKESGVLQAQLTPGASTRVKAGETVKLTLEVQNKGSAPFHQLHAWTESKSNPLLDGREFLFGTLQPGQKKTWVAPVELPRDLPSRRDPITVHFADASGAKMEDVTGEVNIAELPKPRFAFNWQIVDGGDGDGLPDPGEKLTLQVDVKNVGDGPSSEVTFGSIKNKGNEKVFIEKGRFKLGELKPGKTGSATFELELKKGYQDPTVPLQLVIYDEKLGEGASEKLEIPVDTHGLAATPEKGFVKLASDDVVRAAPLDDASPVADTGRAAVLPVQARVGDYLRVEWAKGRTGFVKAPEGKLASSGKGSTLDAAMLRVPPRIALDVDTSQGGAAVDGTRYTLSGTVEDPHLRDVYIFVNDQKVYFSPGTKPATGPVKFSAEFPLKEGSNHVVVVAREDDELASRRAFTVLRRATEVADKSPARPKPTATP